MKKSILLSLLMAFANVAFVNQAAASGCATCERYQEVTVKLQSSSAQEQESGMEQAGIILRDLREKKQRTLKSEEMYDFLKMVASGIKAAQGDTYIYEEYGFYKDKYTREFNRLIRMPNSFTAEEIDLLTKKLRLGDN